MKKNITFFLLLNGLLFSIFVPSVRAQSWLLAGNSNADLNSKLGTTNAIPLQLYTGNQPRVYISTDGKVGIGTVTPAQQFHVEGPTLLNLFVSTSPLSNISGSGQIGYTKFLPTAAGQRLGYFLFGSRGGAENNYHAAGMVGYAAGAWTAGSSYPAYVAFETTPSGSATRSERMRIDQNGRIGIGTTSPGQVLDVRSTSSAFGQFKASSGFAGVILDKSADNQNEYVLHRSAGLTLWSEGTSGDKNFNIHNFSGGGDPVTIDITNNYIGLNAANPAYPLDVAGRVRLRGGGSTSTSAGLWLNNIANSNVTGFMGVLDDQNIGFYGATSGWTFYMNTTSGNVTLAGDGNQLRFNSGQFIRDAPGGNFEIQAHGDFVPDADGFHNLGTDANTWEAVWATDATINTSDARFKKNIENSPYGLKEILKLRPVTYQWKKGPDDGKRIGLIAQEVQPVIPEMVKDSRFVTDHITGKTTKIATTRLGLQYDALIPVLIKGMQEQQDLITQQQQQIEELKTMVNKLANGQSVNTFATNGALLQNIPNPVKGTTAIKYALPEGTNSARMLLTDALGRTIKVVQLTTSGVVNLDVSALSAGVYNYSLVVDGKNIQTKKMTVEK